MNFKNKVVLITGGSAGIGAATAEEFAKRGANVAIIGRNEARLESVTLKCRQYGVKTLSIAIDLTDDEGLKTNFKKVIEKFGKLDILVNNAGVFNTTEIGSDNALEVYDEMQKLNLRAAIHVTNLAAPYLKESKGAIVNISSVVSHVCAKRSDYGMYGALKAALNQFSKATAIELGPAGVRVNIISPGPVRTELLENIDPSINANGYGNYTINNRITEPEEIAKIVLFLAGDDAKSVIGANIVVDNGGMLITA